MRIIKSSQLPFVPASHEDPQNPGVLKRVLATKDELFSGRVQMVNWARLPKGSSFKNHYHEDMEELFILVSGEAEMLIDGVSHRLCEGDMLIVSPNERHMMKNIGDKDCEYLVIGISGTNNGRTVTVA